MKEKIEIWFGDYGVSDDDLEKLDALCPNSADKRIGS